MYKISGEVTKFIENITENWRVKLSAGRKSSTKMKIMRGIFQGDALFTITIRNSDDATHSHTLEMHRRIQTL